MACQASNRPAWSRQVSASDRHTRGGHERISSKLAMQGETGSFQTSDQTRCIRIKQIIMPVSCRGAMSTRSSLSPGRKSWANADAASADSVYTKGHTGNGRRATIGVVVDVFRRVSRHTTAFHEAPALANRPGRSIGICFVFQPRPRTRRRLAPLARTAAQRRRRGELGL